MKLFATSYMLEHDRLNSLNPRKIHWNQTRSLEFSSKKRNEFNDDEKGKNSLGCSENATGNITTLTWIETYPFPNWHEKACFLVKTRIEIEPPQMCK